ncbi:MAG: hypothetical protein QOG33_2826, partial [Gaiellales bacterium]|nr:hypothetical protein [Gaiellales bacterium]
MAASPGPLRRYSLTALIALAALTSAPAADASSHANRLADTQPTWAGPANHKRDAAAGATVVFSVWIGWRDQAGLDQLLAAQQNVSSPLYQQWLTPREFRWQFAPSSQDVRRVSDWLRRDGFDLVQVPQNHLFVTAKGTVAQVEHAFSLNEGLYSVDGRLLRAPDADPTIPGSLAGTVTAITGLDSADSLAQPRIKTPAPPPPTGRSVGPCSHYWGQRSSTQFPNPFAAGQPLPWLICGYTPDQIASAYGIDRLRSSGLDGRGRTIAITGAFFSPTIRADINRFSRVFGLPKTSYQEVVA